LLSEKDAAYKRFTTDSKYQDLDDPILSAAGTH